MFDIREYYLENSLLQESIQNRQDNRNNYDFAVTDDISPILKNPLKQGYATELFKQNKQSITIYTPKTYCPFAGEFATEPDYIRFLLSIYPDKSDLNAVNHIIARPRFIETGQIQLVSLYIPSLRCIVLYLSYPHFYTFNNGEFFGNESFHYDLSTIQNPHYLGTASPHQEILSIPPIFYIVKSITQKRDYTIDKYLLRLNSSAEPQTLLRLDEISHFYNQHGY
ncbi:MAG: hypothetical protein PF637_14195 [Spirochaetes bacterium]|jgi:hypothetical protein|nr:hypothetical protein [Spirochaetota bacterium]